MSFEVEYNNGSSMKKGTVSAMDIKPGTLFRDSDGDLHLRAEDGTIMLPDEEQEEMCVYGEADLENYSKDSFFKKCEIVPGHVTINIELE